MKSSIIFIALVGAVSSNYAAAADHPKMNMLRGIIPAELLELGGCPEVSQCSGGTARNRMAPCRGFCGGGTTDGTCTGAPELCDADPDNFNCNHCCECPGGSGGSTERITDNSGSGKCKTKKTEASEDVEYEFEEEGQSCDCNTDDQCDGDDLYCQEMEKCGGTDKYEFEE